MPKIGISVTLDEANLLWLKGRTLAIACPKLDEGQEVYLEKLVALIDVAKVNTITVMIMQVPCCSGAHGVNIDRNGSGWTRTRSAFLRILRGSYRHPVPAGGAPGLPP